MADPATDPRLHRLLPHLSAFVGFVRRRVGDASLAEDLVQDALAKAVAHVDDLRDDERAEAWFYRILRTVVADLHRRRPGPMPLSQEPAADETVAAEADQATACACLGDLVEALEPTQRDAVRLVDLDGMDSAAAAAALGITENNLKVRRHRGRVRLRELIDGVCRTCAKHGCLDCHCRRSASG